MTSEHHTCDWCGCSMRKIDDQGSGMGAMYRALWLCNNPLCGHEQEHMKNAAAYCILARSGFGVVK